MVVVDDVGPLLSVSTRERKYVRSSVRTNSPDSSVTVVPSNRVLVVGSDSPLIRINEYEPATPEGENASPQAASAPISANIETIRRMLESSQIDR